MKTISAREANQGFPELLAEVAAGEEVVITRRGQPVARLVPFRGDEMIPERERAAAVERMIERMTKGVHLGGLRVRRDEMHER